jgi:hypothetical protein
MSRALPQTFERFSTKPTIDGRTFLAPICMQSNIVESDGNLLVTKFILQLLIKPNNFVSLQPKNLQQIHKKNCKCLRILNQVGHYRCCLVPNHKNFFNIKIVRRKVLCLLPCLSFGSKTFFFFVARTVLVSRTLFKRSAKKASFCDCSTGCRLIFICHHGARENSRRKKVRRNFFPRWPELSHVPHFPLWDSLDSTRQFAEQENTSEGNISHQHRVCCPFFACSLMFGLSRV